MFTEVHNGKQREKKERVVETTRGYMRKLRSLQQLKIPELKQRM